MFLAKPLFTGLVSKAGNFLLSKAKNFFDRNIDTVKNGAIQLLKGGDLQQTLKKTAGNIVNSQKKHLTKAIQRGEGKLKKFISKKERQIQNRIHQYPGPKYLKNKQSYPQYTNNNYQIPDQQAGYDPENQEYQGRPLSQLIQKAENPATFGMNRATQDFNYTGLERLYGDNDQD